MSNSKFAGFCWNVSKELELDVGDIVADVLERFCDATRLEFSLDLSEAVAHTHPKHAALSGLIGFSAFTEMGYDEDGAPFDWGLGESAIEPITLFDAIIAKIDEQSDLETIEERRAMREEAATRLVALAEQIRASL